MARVKQFLAIIGAISIALLGWNLVWPIIDGQGVVTEGGYRELEIGLSKSDVIVLTMTNLKRSKIKLVGYRCGNGQIVVLPEPNCETSIYDANEWSLSYPGLYNESISVEFDGPYIVRIEYFRDLMSP